jgi:cytosine/adenosine deaminase-related metal-dependent hydrolase
VESAGVSLNALFLFNGCDAGGRPACLRIVGGRIAEARPQAGDRRIDLGGARLLPGLINAHDHLQLNALPRLKYRPVYENAAQWIADIDPRLQTDPLLRGHRSVSRQQRLLIGGIKNLLSGVTTVAHHDPDYPPLREPSFPVRVLQGHGWSHSLALDGEAAVAQSQASTHEHSPWIVHAAEGVDAAAAAEFDTLEALGCIRQHTVLVHGLGLTSEQQRRLVQAGAGLVWCPGSNEHLFGRTLDVVALNGLPRLALGSDSRISGERDLLAELALARRLTQWSEDRLESLVTERAAALLGLLDRGVLAPGRLADVLVLPGALPLSGASRADVRLVLVGGMPRYADPELAAAFGPASGLAPLQIDGRPKYLAQALLTALQCSVLTEPGLALHPPVSETVP